MDEWVARSDDVAFLDEGGKTQAVQADGVDAQVDEDGHPARGCHDRGVGFELGDDTVDGRVHGQALRGDQREERAAVTDNAAGENGVGYLRQGRDVCGEGRADDERHRLASISSTRSSESGPMTT